MADQHRFCSLCPGSKAEYFCPCSGRDTFLCSTCALAHFSKDSTRVHMRIPVSVYGQHLIPGYFDRLQARTAVFSQNCEYLRANIAAVDSCIEEFKETVEALIAELRRHSEETLSALQQLRRDLEVEIEAVVCEAEGVLNVDMPSVANPLVDLLRDISSDRFALKLFDFSIDESLTQQSFKKLLKYGQVRTPPSHLMLSLYGSMLRLYSLSSHKVVQESQIPVKVNDGAFYCCVEKDTAVILGANPPTNRVQMLNFSTGDVTLLQPMFEARAWPGVLRYGTWIYVFGSCNATPSVTCEKFSLAIGAWKPLPAMSTGKSSFTPCPFRGTVYLPCVRWDGTRLEVFVLDTEEFRTLAVSTVITWVDSIACILDGELVLASKCSEQTARWKLTDEKEFRVKAYQGHGGFPLSICPPVTRGGVCYFVSSKSGELNSFDGEILAKY